MLSRSSVVHAVHSQIRAVTSDASDPTRRCDNYDLGPPLARPPIPAFPALWSPLSSPLGFLAFISTNE